MERNKLLNLSEELQKPIVDQKKAIIEKYEEYSKQQNRAREELRRNQRDYEIAKERYNRDIQAGKEDAYIDEAHYKDQIQSSQEQLIDATNKRNAVDKFLYTLKTKGFKSAYDLIKGDQSLTQDAPVLLNWIDAVDPVLKKQFATKAKFISSAVGIGSAAAGVYAWLHSNPPSLYAKEVGEAQAAISNMSEEVIGNTKDSLNKLADITTETEKDILQTPEKTEEFIQTLAESKQNIDKSIANLRKQSGNEAKKARKELSDVSYIIGSRLKRLGNIIGVDVNSNDTQETGAANAISTKHTGNSENIKKIQAYIGRRIDPRVIESGTLDQDTQRALEKLEDRISQQTGKDVKGLLLRNGKVIQYDDFVKLMQVVFK